MLKKIPVSALCLGMHLHRLEASWLSHTFWKTRFIISSASDLAALQGSGVAECWIDDELGLAPGAPTKPETSTRSEPPEAQQTEAPAPAQVWVQLEENKPVQPAVPAHELQRPALAAPPEPQVPMRAELQRAAAICANGRQAVTAMFNEARMGRSVDAAGCLPLVEEISKSVGRNPSALVSLARLKTKDDYSYMHSVATCALMVALGRQLGLGDDECREAGMAGLLHDIGKALMPLDILNKPAKLTDEEFDVMRTHPARGHALLKDGGSASESVLDVALHHHERFDGKGYPRGLKGENISRLSRMAALCDVYDAITSNRPYKSGWDPADSVARMFGWKGQFDPNYFAAFVQSLGIYPTGSLVKLESGRLAVVLEQNRAVSVSPVVRVFFCSLRKRALPVEELDLASPGCQDRIIGRQPRAPGQSAQIEQLWASPEALGRATVGPSGQLVVPAELGAAV